MKYALAFIASFALFAGVTSFIRVQASDAPVAETQPQDQDENKREAPKKGDDKKDAHDGHDMGEKKDDAKKDDAKKDDAKKETPEWDGEVETDLANKTDPVSGVEIPEGAQHYVVHHGFKVHFADEKSIKKFKRRPIQYFVPLELEKTTDGKVKKVNAEDFKDPPIIPATCPFMGGDISKDDGVYIFHRGYRIYFCCWNGCWEDFLKEPSEYYGEYGLVDKDGKLVPKDK
jgi:YHS domain-containing protein